MTGITDFAGRTTTLTYDGDELFEIIEPDPDGAGPLQPPTTTFAYDADGRLISMLDARGNPTTFEHDAYGLASGGSNQDGTSWQLTSALSRLLVDPTSGLGDLNNPAPAIPTESLSSDFSDPRGYTESTVTDAFGLATSIRDALDNHYQWNRDFEGRVTSAVEPDPDGAAGPLSELITSYTYASCTNVSEVEFADQSNQRWTYNAISLPTQFIDEIGRTTKFQYDGTDVDGDGVNDGLIS